jgi:hypothetical protein
VGIDFAGKTGSAQTISNEGKARLTGKGVFKDNGWFVGVTSRRNPEIVVAVLFEEGEHGKLAARVASQVIQAYVEKQRKRDWLLARGHSADEVLRTDLTKIELPRDVVDRFSPPASVASRQSPVASAQESQVSADPGLDKRVANKR